jgi:hypothetical protein
MAVAPGVRFARANPLPHIGVAPRDRDLPRFFSE